MAILIARLALFAALFSTASMSCAASDPMPRHYISSQQLNLFCNTVGKSDDEARLMRALCQTYVVGVVDGHELVALVSPKPLRVFCLPEGIFNAQLTDAVIAWMKKNKVELNEPAAPSVFSALKDAFPCTGTRN